MTGTSKEAVELTEDQILALKDRVMTLEYHGGLWVTAEDYEALARLAPNKETSP